MSHKRQVVSDRGIRERTYHASLWPARGLGDPSLLARGAEKASQLATGTVVWGEGHFTPPLHPSYFTGHFTPERNASIYQTIQIEASQREKLHVAETLYEAGATPPRDARCVARTVRSLPPHESTEAHEKSTETDEATSLLCCASGGARVNGARTTRFTHPFTDLFTVKAVRSHTDYIPCASRDDEFGRVSELRGELRAMDERYVLDVPCNTLVRDPTERRAPSCPGGRPRLPLFERVDAWTARQPKGRWRKMRIRAGEKGWLEVKALQHRMQTKEEGGHVGPRERLVVIRSGEKNPRTWYTLSNASAEASAALAAKPCASA